MVRMPNEVQKRTNPDEARKERNRLNRQRGKRMEAEISKIFLGNTRGRVAFSGAGAEKGDNKIPLPNNSGNLYIECKTSALVKPKFGPGLPLRYEWFDIIEKHRIAMGSRLGILAIHFHNISGNYAFFRVADIPVLEAISGNTGYVFNGPVIDNRFNKSGKRQVTDTFFRSKMLDSFKASTGIVPNLIYATFQGPYICVDITDFKMLAGYPDRVEARAA